MDAKVKYNWKKIGKAALWLALGGVLVVLSISAISNKRSEKVTGIHVNFHGSGESNFTTAVAITQLMNKVQGTEIVPQAIGRLKLSAMEQAIEEMKWVRQAEIFMDNNGILQVSIYEKMPVARVFSGNGHSWYLSSDLKRLPLPAGYLDRLPVFTNYPADLKGRKDSTLLMDVKAIALFIQSHPFWMAQAEQIDINEDGEFVITPKLGNQIILFGNADDYKKKFNNLLCFYQKVQTRTGWSKYSKIDLRFDNQIVATRRDAEELKEMQLKSTRMREEALQETGHSPDKEYNSHSSLTDFAVTNPKEQKEPRKMTPGTTTEKLRQPTPKMQPPVNSANPQFLSEAEKKLNPEMKKHLPPERTVKKKIQETEKRTPKAVMPPPTKEENEK